MKRICLHTQYFVPCYQCFAYIVNVHLYLIIPVLYCHFFGIRFSVIHLKAPSVKVFDPNK